MHQFVIFSAHDVQKYALCAKENAILHHSRLSSSAWGEVGWNEDEYEFPPPHRGVMGILGLAEMSGGEGGEW